MPKQSIQSKQMEAQVDEARILAALADIDAGRFKTAARAARHYGIKARTLQRRRKGARSLSSNGGHNKALNEAEELALLAWVNWRQSIGSAITSVTLLQAVNSIVSKRAIPPARDITKRWAQKWLTQHKNLLKRTRGTPRAVQRRAAQDRAVLREWFDAYKLCVDTHSISDENSWNSDEAGFRVGVFDGNLVWCYLDIEVWFQSDPDRRSLVTVIETCSAAGFTIPPFVIMAGVNINGKHVQNSLDPGTVLTTSESGWTDDLVALEWLDHFLENTKPSAPTDYRLLLIDNHGSHLTFPFWKKCQRAKVVLFPLPPHTTHKLQPLDVGIFSAYKRAHQTDLSRQIELGAADYDRPEFLDGLKNMRRRAFKVSTVKSAWAKCGLSPFNPQVVLDNLEDPLTSAKSEAVMTQKVGYIPNAGDQIRRLERRGQTYASFFDEDHEDLPALRTPSPDLLALNWKEAKTPTLDLSAIIPYEDWLEERLHAAAQSGRSLSLTIFHVFLKMKKASHAAILAGARAIEELRRRENAEVERKQRASLNRLITKVGPITAGDARLRAINNENNRLVFQRRERRRLRGKDLKSEDKILRHWLKEYKRQEVERCKQLRARLRLQQIKRQEITALVAPQEAALKSEATLFKRYWQQRRERDDRFHQLQEEALVLARLQSSRPEEDVALPSDWQPAEALPPYTPWRLTHRDEGTVRKVMRAYWKAKYGADLPFPCSLQGKYTPEEYEVSSPDCTDTGESDASGSEASNRPDPDEKDAVVDLTLA
ncbi:hypothetical protein RB595_007971 [Gaeumannomyces hyphopodioides]